MKQFLFFSLFLPSLIFASELEERVSRLEEGMKQIHMKTDADVSRSQFAPDIFQRSWIGILFKGDALFWHAKAGGTEYVYNFVAQTLGLDCKSADVKEQNFSWGFGFRVGVGLSFSVIGWELYTHYTRFYTSNTDSQLKTFPALLVNLKKDFLAPSNQSLTDCSLSYDNIDITLNYFSFMSRFLSVQTAIGIKTSRLDQQQSLRHYLLENQEVLRLKDRCNFWGIGPLIRFGTKWHLFWGFSFSVDVSGSVLYGDFDMKHREEAGIGEIDLKGGTHLLSPIFQLFTGLGWDLYRDWCHFMVSLGYEVEYFFRGNESFQLENRAKNRAAPIRRRFQVMHYAEDLAFYGATIKVILEF